MSFPTYPATTIDQAEELVRFSSNQLHDIINGTAVETVATEGGPIDTVRKALTDNFYFKSPIAWQASSDETVYNQLREYGGYWYYAPTARTTNPVLMSGSPIGDLNWRLFSQGAANTTPVFGGQYRNMNILLGGSDYTGSITCDRLIVENDSYQTVLLRDVSLSFDANIIGVNGRDAGIISPSTWYYVYVIYNANTQTTAGLISTSSSSPTLPSGYDYFTNVGEAYSLSTSFRGSKQTNDLVLWCNPTGESTAVTLVFESASASTTAFSTLAAKPPTANVISVRFVFPTGSSGWGELGLTSTREIPLIYINITEQAFVYDVPEFVPSTLYYTTSGPSAKVTIISYGYRRGN